MDTGFIHLSRTRQLVGFALRMVCFLVVTFIICDYALYVLTPKNDYGICSILQYYEQSPETVDVLVLGTSVAYSGINTNILWKEYGIAAFDLCGAEMPYWTIYYYLKEALKTQTPKLILLDAKPSIYALPYSKKGRVILSTDGIRSPINRFSAIVASTHPNNTLSFLIGFPRVHGNYTNLTMEDFVFPPSNGGRGSSWKGYIEMNAVDEFMEPVVKWEEDPKEMQDKQRSYFEKILQLAHARDIPLMLIGMPNPDYGYDHPYFLGLRSIAEDYGIVFLDYNIPGSLPGLNYALHFADWQHLNVDGSVLFTEKMGRDLLERHSLPDHRGDKQWESWEICADQWLEQYSEWTKREKE